MGEAWDSHAMAWFGAEIWRWEARARWSRLLDTPRLEAMLRSFPTELKKAGGFSDRQRDLYIRREEASPEADRNEKLRVLLLLMLQLSFVVFRFGRLLMWV